MHITDFYDSYGLLTVFAVVLLQQLGAPIPASPVLVLAGAKAIEDPVHGIWALVLAIVGSAIGSIPWFYAGRRHGHRVLELLCRISLSPDSCVRRTEGAFERYGPPSLVVAKFIPGFARVAAPLAGALRVRLGSFLVYTSAGAALWAGSALVLGLLFNRQIDWLLERLASFGLLGLALLAALLALYVAFRFFDRWRFRRTLRGARIAAAELYQMMRKGEDPIVLDVRSESHRKIDGRTIPGAKPVDPERIVEQGVLTLAREREVIVYCSCPNDATAVKVALLLRKHGIRRVRPLAGGIDAWVAATLNRTRSAAAAR
ncbi:MAG TPA: VTT domain-containing protein [Burkholderiales bacterium]|nr:VTT domain-containing protein [Burkholderiales bacterium]